MPLPPPTEVRPRTVKWGYYMNVCTMGYSLVFTDWAYWEKQIDWMAMNGINLPLAFVGQEWIWAEVFTKDYGLSWDDLNPFFTGVRASSAKPDWRLDPLTPGRVLHDRRPLLLARSSSRRSSPGIAWATSADGQAAT